MTNKQLARSNIKVSHILGDFKLRSGFINNKYFDKYLFEANPQITKLIAKKTL